MSNVGCWIWENISLSDISAGIFQILKVTMKPSAFAKAVAGQAAFNSGKQVLA